MRLVLLVLQHLGMGRLKAFWFLNYRRIDQLDLSVWLLSVMVYAIRDRFTVGALPGNAFRS